MSEAGGSPGGSGIQEKAQEVGGQAQEKAQEVAAQAGEKAQEAAGRAQDAVRQQVDQRTTQAGEQVTSSASDMRSVAEELRKQGKDTPAKFAEQAADRAQRVGSYLKEKDADTMLSDAEDFGRERPMVVLLGGLAIGIAAARFLKSSSGGRYRSRQRSEQRTRELGAGMPPGAEYPTEPVAVPASQPERVPVTPNPVVGP